MPTTSTLRSETRSISINASPDAVLNLVADPYRLPSWAPNFARAVRPDGDGWLIESGGDTLRITVDVSRECGTVDLLGTADQRRGAFSRVLPNGEGSEYLFTLFFADGSAPSAIEAQMAVVETELHAIRELCQAS